MCVGVCVGVSVCVGVCGCVGVYVFKITYKNALTQVYYINKYY